jgi:uncharacterized membrane protein YbjE (DUF340 family)
MLAAEITITVLRWCLRAIMRIVMRFRDDKSNYLIAPEYLIRRSAKERIMKLGHLLSSTVVSILLVVKVFPLASQQYARELEKNSGIIATVFTMTAVGVLVANGIIIEVILERTNRKYFDYKRQLQEL